jgi:Flp pilus assembly protein TadG
MAITTTSRRDDRGQAVIELALTLPLLLVVVFGIIDFGFMFQRYEAVTNAAREGARLGVLQDYSAGDARERARTYLAASGLPATPGNERACGGAEVRNTWCAQLTPSTVTIAGSSPPRTVDQVTMVVEFDHDHSFLGPILRLLGPTWTTVRLRAVSSMRSE